MGKTNTTSSKSYLLLIFSISLAIFMSSLDGTIVNIALPTISESFGVSTSAVTWVATAYLLVMAGCVLIFGKISDFIGYKRIFLSGFVVFTLGSFACGFLPELLDSFYVLVGSRAFQGIGGAMISAIAPAMVTAFIPMEQKGKAMGIIMTVAALGTAIGPTIGGLLTQYISWHWIFFINVPIGILSVIVGMKAIPGQSDRNATLSGFDRSGAAFIFIGLAALLFAVSEGEVLGWTSPAILVSGAVAAVSLGLFVWRELHAAEPLLELGLFGKRNFLLTNLILVLVFFGFSGINYLLPFYLQYVLGYEISAAGMVLTSLSFAMMVSGLAAGLLYNRVGGRILAIAAAAIIAAGYSMMTHLQANTTIAYVVAALIVIGFGLGLMVTPVSNMIMNSVAKRYQGMVSSLTSLERFAPMTIGIAIFNLIFVQGVLRIAENRDITMQSPVEVKMHLLSAGFDIAFFGAFIVAVVVLVLAFLARQEVHPDYLDAGDEGAPEIGMMI
ncbi:MFS transporter [Methanofollis tationis]|uniref:MFS transporter n=1 Tax=Methanofollis tationis TaxID=81417 RepID=A0A7K4HN08_9EURY|nr:MFS transporter [Methanofollis tationis]NVO66248.1 MFS transporter [Methanofollis tationis]